MATWGKKKIRLDGYGPESTMYYEYNTTSDQYYLKQYGTRTLAWVTKGSKLKKEWGPK